MTTQSSGGTNAILADDGTVANAAASYLRSQAEPTLYRSYDFVPFATEAEIPGGQGIYMNIPFFVQTGSGASTTGVRGATFGDRANALAPVAAAQEAFPLLTTDLTVGNLRQSSIDQIDRKMAYFADGFQISKMNKAAITVQGEFERIAEFIMKTAAATHDILVQNNIIYEGGDARESPIAAGTIWNAMSAQGFTSGEPIYVSPNADGSAWGSIIAGDGAVANQFALARKYLKSVGNPGFSKLGGKLAALVGPDTVYRLSTQVTTASGQATLTWEQESMNDTRVFTDAVVGDLFGFRLIETSNPIVIDADTTNGPSTTAGGAGTPVDCEINVLFAPDAFYVTPHAVLTPQLYVTGFDEGGILNPTKSVSSLATDFTFGAVRGPDFANKMALMPCPIA